MSGQDLYERLLSALHASALGDTPWTAASKAIDEFCGTKGNHLVYGEGTAVDGIDIFFAEFCFRGERDEEMERVYFGTYHKEDERLPRIRDLPDSKLVHVPSLFSDAEKKSSAMYNEGLVLGKARDGLNVRLDGPAGSRIVWTVSDPVDLDGWTTERRAAVESVLPQLRQFVRVRHALTRAWPPDLRVRRHQPDPAPRHDRCRLRHRRRGTPAMDLHWRMRCFDGRTLSPRARGVPPVQRTGACRVHPRRRVALHTVRRRGLRSRASRVAHRS